MWLFVLRSFEFGFGCSYGIGFRFGGCLFMWSVFAEFDVVR